MSASLFPEPPSSDQDSRPLTETERDRLALRARSPLRAATPQDDVDGLPIFDAERSPRMF